LRESAAFRWCRNRAAEVAVLTKDGAQVQQRIRDGQVRPPCETSAATSSKMRFFQKVLEYTPQLFPGGFSPMFAKLQCRLITLTVLLLTSLCARAQLSIEMPPAPNNERAPGTLKENPKDGLNYVWIPPGEFMMGCSPADSECHGDEKPQHRVRISKGFWMGQTEVTQKAYGKYAGEAGKQVIYKQIGDELPMMTQVSWYSAANYCKWAGGRLPTEAEWEYAARAGSTKAYYGELDKIAWYDQNSGRSIHEVGQKRSNAFGLFDMLGNVWEWVNDRYDANYYRKSPEVDPSGPDTGQTRVLRGGSWGYNASVLRVSDRGIYQPYPVGIVIGFRCVLGKTVPLDP
jgi:formylglycine-generating enzyme required for sulfatase activity